MLDGEIGDAAPRIQPVGRNDGRGRAGGYARLAGAAVRAGRRIERQRQVRQDLAQKETGARVAGDEVGMFADPAQARIARERFFEHRRAVDTNAKAEGPDTASARLSARVASARRMIL